MKTYRMNVVLNQDYPRQCSARSDPWVEVHTRTMSKLDQLAREDRLRRAPAFIDNSDYCLGKILEDMRTVGPILD